MVEPDVNGYWKLDFMECSDIKGTHTVCDILYIICKLFSSSREMHANCRVAIKDVFDSNWTQLFLSEIKFKYFISDSAEQNRNFNKKVPLRCRRPLLSLQSLQ